MASFAVVLDACVLVPAALRDTLLRAAARDLYRMHWSETILTEVQRTLIDGFANVTEEGAGRLLAAIREHYEGGRVNPSADLIQAMTNDPKDRHVLAAAVMAGAQVVVTHNLRHFPEEALRPYSIEAQAPDQFLLHLLDLDRDTMMRIIMEQAASLSRPPQSVHRTLDNLARDAPQFAESVRALLPPPSTQG